MDTTPQNHEARIPYRHNNSEDEYVGKIWEADRNSSFDLYIGVDGITLVYRWGCVASQCSRHINLTSRQSVRPELVRQAREMLGPRYPRDEQNVIEVRRDW